MSGKSNFNFPPDQWHVEQGEWGVDFYENTGSVEDPPGTPLKPFNTDQYIVVEKEAGVVPINTLINSEFIHLQRGVYVVRGYVYFPNAINSGDLYVAVRSSLENLADPDNPFPPINIGINTDTAGVTPGNWYKFHIFRPVFQGEEKLRLSFGLQDYAGFPPPPEDPILPPTSLPDQADPFLAVIDSISIEQDPCLFSAKKTQIQNVSGGAEIEPGIWLYTSLVNFESVTSSNVSNPDFFITTPSNPAEFSYYSAPKDGMYQIEATIALEDLDFLNSATDPYFLILRISQKTAGGSLIEQHSLATPVRLISTNQTDYIHSAFMANASRGDQFDVSISLITVNSGASFDISTEGSRFSGFRINE